MYVGSSKYISLKRILNFIYTLLTKFHLLFKPLCLPASKSETDLLANAIYGRLNAPPALFTRRDSALINIVVRTRQEAGVYKDKEEKERKNRNARLEKGVGRGEDASGDEINWKSSRSCQPPLLVTLYRPHLTLYFSFSPLFSFLLPLLCINTAALTLLHWFYPTERKKEKSEGR